MSESFEGLDPTAEAELDLREAEPAPDHASMLRALRELEAAKQRVERDARREANELRAALVRDLLPFLDNLDRAIEASTDKDGLRLLRAQLADVLTRYGLESFDARAKPFDPRIHEAVSVVSVSQRAAHDVVIEQLSPGYKFGDRMLRPAKVVVGRLVRYH